MPKRDVPAGKKLRIIIRHPNGCDDRARLPWRRHPVVYDETFLDQEERLIEEGIIGDFENYCEDEPEDPSVTR